METRDVGVGLGGEEGVEVGVETVDGAVGVEVVVGVPRRTETDVAVELTVSSKLSVT